ncbi:AAA family ATPase [Succinivibrio dextrinosolvens]|uniref:AAA family ATPase n=1 Tax=Succinivibrio dextrinosolvens TaxID=83771 RepID=UPI0013E98093|nr:AAA family ATPase [Succinivibrio dextrinosolvens]
MDFEKQSIGTEDFAEHIRTKKIYIDKTSYLPELYGEKVHPNGMRYEDKVLLITRPRRFGKSLTMSMIKNFFELNYANPKDKSNPKELFQNLAISKDQDFCDKYMGEYPVISISLRGINGTCFASAIGSFLFEIGRVYNQYSFILNSDILTEKEKSDFNYIIDISNQNDFDKWYETHKIDSSLKIKNSLFLLTYLLNKIYKKKCIVIVDEYDVPLQKATVENYYKEMLDVVRGMFEKVFKTNEYLEKGIVTGCLRISHESIFTGINNFSIYTVNDEGFNKFIGFTHDEVVELLQKQKLSSKENTVMKWYDGYNFSGARMLCPWSVLNYCESAGKADNLDEHIPGNYWINTSGNDIVDICLKHPDAQDSMRLQNLLDGNTEIIESSDFTSYPQINTETDFDTMMNMMLHTGYLTAVKTYSDRRLEVKIPNQEVLESFRERTKKVFSKQNTPWYEKVKSLKAALFNNDKDKVQTLINELLINFVSVRNTAQESYYQGFLSGVLSLTVDDPAELQSDTESGKGFSDLKIISDLKKNAIIIEFKKLEKGESFEDICAEALQQIEEKQYAYPYAQKNYRILKYGIGFYGKECWVATP